jgi:hypothetical protein
MSLRPFLAVIDSQVFFIFDDLDYSDECY